MATISTVTFQPQDPQRPAGQDPHIGLQARILSSNNQDPAMANGIRMRPHPTTFSLGGIHLAIAEGPLCLRVDTSAEWLAALCCA